MQGDERVRHCSECNLNVYNFSAMSEREIQRLLLAKNGKVCARWYRRRDGTILTADCPVGFRARIKRISLVAGTALSALFGMSTAAAETSGKTSSSTVKIERCERGSGVIVVRVADETGAMIQKATVTVLDASNKLVVEGQTDTVGEFQAAGLRHGAYSVRVSSLGFHESETRGIVVESSEEHGTAVTVHMSLGVAATMGAVVLVSDEAPLPEGVGDIPVLLPLASDNSPAPKRNPAQRIISKGQGTRK
jgi:uncharacterized protein (DUF2141 family)